MKQAKPIKVSTISIDLYSNGSIQVRDFPQNVAQAIQVMNQAAATVALHFVNLGAQGKLSNEKQHIIKPDKSIIRLH